MKRAALLAKWHRLSSPTPQTSRQLLDALTSSFRRRLDYEHPPAASSPQAGNHHSPSENPNSSVEATDRHMSDILNNPLFRMSAKTPEKTKFQKERLARDPMGLFDDQVASGAMTAYYVDVCLKSQLALIGTSSPSNVREGMRASRAGSKVSSWWWSSGFTDRVKLWKHQGFITALCKFMVAEGLQDMIMYWLSMCVERRVGRRNWWLSNRDANVAFYRFLGGLVGSEILYGRGLPSAVEYYTQACRMRLAMDDFPCNWMTTAHMTYVGLAEIGCTISGSDSKQIKEIPVDVFEDFTSLLLALSPRALVTTSMALYHPTDPDPEPFLEFLRRRASRDDARPLNFHQFCYQASSTAMRLLVNRGSLKEASEVANLILQMLPSEEPSPSQSNRADETSPEDDTVACRLGLNSA